MPSSSDSEPPRYDASMTKLVSARESVRMRPGMYIRETDHQKMLHELLWQTVDGLLWHSRFLVPSPHQIKITVQLESDGSASVASAVRPVSAGFLEQSVPSWNTNCPTWQANIPSAFSLSTPYLTI